MGEYEYTGIINSSVKFEYFPLKVQNPNNRALEVVRNSIAPFTEYEKEMDFSLCRKPGWCTFEDFRFIFR